MVEAAKALYKEYVSKGLSEEHPFKGVGTRYILFSAREPKLFQLLFMREQPEIPDLKGVLPLIEESYEEILLSIRKDYGISRASAEKCTVTFGSTPTHSHALRHQDLPLYSVRSAP